MFKKVIFSLIVFLTCTYANAVVLESPPSTDVSDKQCLECHGVKGYSAIYEKDVVRSKRSIDVSHQAMLQSLHGNLKCVECHKDIKELPH